MTELEEGIREIEAMAKTATALESFEPHVRRRMLEWLLSWNQSQVNRWMEWEHALRDAQQEPTDD